MRYYIWHDEGCCDNTADTPKDAMRIRDELRAEGHADAYVTDENHVIIDELPAEELKLFAVTLYWNPSNSDDGDYSTNVWAADEDSAIRAVAEEMADEDGPDDESERAEFIQDIIDGAGTYAAQQVGLAIPHDLRVLMNGPKGEMSPQAQADYQAIMDTLSRYGVKP